MTDNTALMESQPDYIEQFKNLPEKQKRMFLYGLWDVAEGMFFEDFRVGTKEQQATGLYTHVIEPFEIPPNWTIYRSFAGDIISLFQLVGGQSIMTVCYTE